jgi:predicted TIM-barrel fold metal-dependent hydrolase
MSQPAPSREEIIEPGLAICDPHHHLWHMSEAAADHLTHVPITEYLLPQFLDDLNAGHNVVSTVYMQAGAFLRANVSEDLAPIGETEFANGMAAMSASGRYGPTRIAAGIVGHANLSLGAAVESLLEAHIRVGGGRLRGIRVTGSYDPAGATPWGTAPAGLYLDATFREGFARLADFDLSFDAWCYHVGIPDLTDLARAFPDQPIMLDHIGTPLGVGPYASRKDEVFAEWRAALQELARCPNVAIKLGGLGMFMLGIELPDRHRVTSDVVAAAWRPYLETAIEIFGEDRALFESNFPVDALACSYAVLWNAFKRIASGCTADVKRKLFHDNAVRFYKL